MRSARPPGATETPLKNSLVLLLLLLLVFVFFFNFFLFILVNRDESLRRPFASASHQHIVKPADDSL